MRSVRAKCNIILCLVDAVASQTRSFVDNDEKTACDLWKELESIFTLSNAEVVQNIKQKLDTLIFKDNGNWDKHVASFLTTIGELAKYDAELSESEKTSKLIRSLTSSFAPLAMVSSQQDLNFDKIFNAVRTEIARRANLHNMQQPSDNSTSQPKANFAQRGNRGSRGRGRGRGRRGRRIEQRGTFGGRVDKCTCKYCKRPGHFYNDCCDRLRDEGTGSVKAPQGRPSLRPNRNVHFGQLPDAHPPRGNIRDNADPLLAVWKLATATETKELPAPRGASLRRTTKFQEDSWRNCKKRNSISEAKLLKCPARRDLAHTMTLVLPIISFIHENRSSTTRVFPKMSWLHLVYQD